MQSALPHGPYILADAMMLEVTKSENLTMNLMECSSGRITMQDPGILKEGENHLQQRTIQIGHQPKFGLKKNGATK